MIPRGGKWPAMEGDHSHRPDSVYFSVPFPLLCYSAATILKPVSGLHPVACRIRSLAADWKEITAFSVKKGKT